VSDEHVGGGGDSGDVGDVGEEAAKLLGALQDWAKESGAGGALGGGLGGLGDLGAQWRSVNEHIATGGADCTYCPVCQLIARVRETSPEVRSHVAVAASSLLQAAAALIEARAPKDPGAAAGGPSGGTSGGQPGGQPGVTKIDLDDDPMP
jgi:hypothetical protein